MRRERSQGPYAVQTVRTKLVLLAVHAVVEGRSPDLGRRTGTAGVACIVVASRTMLDTPDVSRTATVEDTYFIYCEDFEAALQGEVHLNDIRLALSARWGWAGKSAMTGARHGAGLRACKSRVRFSLRRTAIVAEWAVTEPDLGDEEELYQIVGVVSSTLLIILR